MPQLKTLLLAAAVACGVASCASAGQGQLNSARSGFVAPAANTIGAPAQALATAVQGTRTQILPFPTLPSLDNPTMAGCQPEVLSALVQGNRTVLQWIVVLAPSSTSTTASLEIVTLGSDDTWHCSLAATTARLGRNGLRPLVERRSGDDTTPSGIFALGIVNSPQGPISFFGNSPDPGALGAYRRVQTDDCYGANPTTAGYGHWRSDVAGCTGADEQLHSIGAAYEHAVLIGANTEPDVSGDAVGEIAYASAIFLHRFTYTAAGSPKPTSGCISIGHNALVTALRTIDPKLNPHFAIGTVPMLTAG